MLLSRAARPRLIALTIGLGTALALSGCGSVDDALFGNQAAAPAPAPAPTAAAPSPATAEAAPAPTESAPAPAAETETASSGEPPAPATAPAPAPAVAPGDLGITIAAIEPGTSTGTSVGQTVDKLRSDLSALHDKAAADLTQFTALRTETAQDVSSYQTAKSRIIVHLQVGTTKGNPELVGAWNTSQSALDSLTGNINALARLASDISADVSRARTQRDTIRDTLNAPGAVDEDHRQLNRLQEEADQVAGALEQMQRIVAQSVQRETSFAANERGDLINLEGAIKNGDLFPTSDMGVATTASLNPTATSIAASSAITTIRFDKKKVEFEKQLYDALNQTLQSKPGASFRVVAVSPPQGSASGVQMAQKEAHRHAEEVLKSMTDMGVPATRVSISSSTDPAATSSEVRVFVR